MDDQDRTPSSPLDAFLAAFMRDREAGAVRPLGEYLIQFPGDDKRIAREYLALEDGDSPEAPADRVPGVDRVAHYRKIRQIGRGGQGTVYLAEDTRLHRQVALKVMDPGFASDAIAVERFKREAEITSKLDHPGICTVYETGEDRGSRWIAMRYVEGESLAKTLARDCEDGVGRPDVRAWRIEVPGYVIEVEDRGQDLWRYVGKGKTAAHRVIE